MKGHTLRTLIAVAFMLFPVGAFAQQPTIQVDHVWSRAAAAGGTGVVYLTVTDSGAADRLTGAASPVAAATQATRNCLRHKIFADVSADFNDIGVLAVRHHQVLGLGETQELIDQVGQSANFGRQSLGEGARRQFRQF